MNAITKHVKIDYLGRNTVDWTKSDDLDRTLRELWAEGLSTVEIARQLGVTKNAVVGRRRRLNLPPRLCPIKRVGPFKCDMPKQPRVPDPNPEHKPTHWLTNAEIAILREKSQKSNLSPIIAVEVVAELPKKVINVKPPKKEHSVQVCLDPVQPPISRIPLTAKCLRPLWGDRERPTHQYCDKPAPQGTSWCLECRPRMFTTFYNKDRYHG